LNKTEVLERHNNNRQSFKEIASELEKDVTEFLKRDSLMSRPNISPSQYKEFFVKQKKYLIHTQKIETGLLNNRIADMEAYIELLKKENEQLDNQLRILEKRTGVALVKKILRKDREDKNSSRG
jgi:predicted metal-binding transcription factor (methanogenesis marker protein 9)